LLTHAEFPVSLMALTWKGLWTAFAGAMPFFRSADAPRGARFAAAAGGAPVGRMTSVQQWDKVAGVLTSAIESATSAKELHASAAQQLDLATYALYNLFDDLSSVMSEPLVRGTAVVHRLPPKAKRTQAQALAA
jgi:hypothetical protein